MCIHFFFTDESGEMQEDSKERKFNLELLLLISQAKD